MLVIKLLYRYVFTTLFLEITESLGVFLIQTRDKMQNSFRVLVDTRPSLKTYVLDHILGLMEMSEFEDINTENESDSMDKIVNSEKEKEVIRAVQKSKYALKRAFIRLIKRSLAFLLLPLIESAERREERIKSQLNSRQNTTNATENRYKQRWSP